jgi:outer membrane protein assembly complex protein YaeT
VVFTAEPGVLAHFGPVLIEKNKSVSDRVIERELDFKPGDLYSRSVIQNAQRRLYGMALFQFVDIKPIDSDQQAAQVRTRVTVAEGKHQRVNFGIGYGSEERGRVDAEYHHLNFFGSARSAGVHARWSSLDRGVRFDLNQPYLFGPHLSLGGEAQQWYTFTPAYESIVTGAKATLLHRSGPQLSWSASMTRERNTSAIVDRVLGDPQLRNDLIALGLDPTTGKQEGTLSALGVDLQRSTADSLLNPSRGYQLALHAEEAGVLLPGTFNYYAVSVDGRYYQSVGHRLVMAGRLQIGNIDSKGSSVTNVPFSRKYFLGGASALRGWGRYEVSPLSTSGLPIGGNSLLAFTTEARATLRGSLGAVLFLDAGNVWEGAGGMDLNGLRYAIGPGFRYETPVGPVRVDVGYQINPIDGLVVNGKPQTRRWRFHFSIGQAF